MPLLTNIIMKGGGAEYLFLLKMFVQFRKKVVILQPKTCGATFAHSPRAPLVTHSSPLQFREEKSI